MKVREAIFKAAKRLEAHSDTARLDAELLMAHALGVERQQLLLVEMENEAPHVFHDLVKRREQGEPAAYIIGRRGFWTIEVEVGPGVLIPRPDSETLIEAAVAHFGKAGPRTILDLGTGPGTLLLAALDEWPQAQGIGIDRSGIALSYARRNAERLGFSKRAAFRHGDWTEGLEGQFDLILCNPPYVETGALLPKDVLEWEPHEALFAGEAGLDEYRRLAPAIAPYLTPGGIACLEIGAEQTDSVKKIFQAQGYTVGLRRDLGGRPRCLILSY